MKNKYFVLILFIAFSSPSVASEKDYKICSVGGYFSGASDRFLSGLAMHIAHKRHIFGDPICSAAWKNGVEIGEYSSKTGKIKGQAEGVVVQQAVEFSTQVYDAVSSNINF